MRKYVHAYVRTYVRMYARNRLEPVLSHVRTYEACAVGGRLRAWRLKNVLDVIGLLGDCAFVGALRHVRDEHSWAEDCVDGHAEMCVPSAFDSWSGELGVLMSFSCCWWFVYG